MTSSGADRESQMLAEGAALRRLARSLVRADADAEDLVQDTLAASLVSGNDDARKRPWLMGTLRNLALLWRRSSTRRAAREGVAAAATSRHCGDPAVIAAQAETMRDVAAAVHELEEPFRTVIVLRFWRGLMPEAIAAELGVPRNTVRSRLQRGLEKLRERLDRSHGDRRSWLAALVPFASHAGLTTLAAAPAGAAATTWTTSGALLMTKLHVVFAAATLAAVGCLVWWFGQGAIAPISMPPAATDRAAVARATTDATNPENGSASAPGSSPTHDLRTAVDAAVGLEVRGTVLRDGAPVAGLTLDVQFFGGTDVLQSPTEQQQVQSDADGKFVWHGPLRTAVGMVRAVRSGTSGVAKVFCTPQPVEPGQTEVVLDVTALALARTIFGRVHDVVGAPIVGAELSVNGWTDVSTRTDANGHYELRVTGPPYPLLVLKDGFRERLLESYIPEGKDQHELDVELEPGAPFTGSVVDAAGNPIAGASIRASALARGTDTDAAGHFEFGGAANDERQELTATKAGFQRASVVASAGGDPVRIVMQPGIALPVRVVDTDGAGIPGVRIGVTIDSYRGAENRGLTDVDGRLRIMDLPAKTLTVLADKAGFVKARGEVDVKTMRDELVLVLRPGRTIAGRALDAAGAPVVGVSVSCTMQGTGLARSAVGSRAKTDTEGRFTIQELPPEPCTVTAHHPDYRHAVLEGVSGTPADLVLRMQPAASVAGRVVDGITGAPVAAFQVLLAADHKVQPLQYVDPVRFADSDGFWRVKHWQLKPGAPLVVEVWAEGYAPQRVDSVVMDDAPRDQNLIRMFAGTTVSGTVVDAKTGTPVSQVEITLQSGDPMSQTKQLGPNSPTPDTPVKVRVFSDAEGRFELRSVPPGENRLMLTRQGYPTNTYGPFQVTAGAPTLEVQPKLTPGATLRGRVTGLADTLGKKLTAHGRDDDSFEAELAADGSFELHGVGPGRASLSLITGKGCWHSMRIMVGTDDLENIVFEVPKPGTGSIRASVIGLPRGHGSVASLDVTPGQCSTVRTIEFTDATFVIEALPPGRYEVEVYSLDAGGSGRAEVTVADREVAVTVEVVKR